MPSPLIQYNTDRENIFESSLFQKKKVEIHDSVGNIIFIDATLSENHNRSSQATMHSIEEGGEVADHIIKKGVQLDLNGIISDDPISIGATLIGTASGVVGSLVGGVGGAIVTGTSSYMSGILLNSAYGRSMTALQIFEQIYEQKLILTIITGLTGYENMVMETLSMPRNQGTKRALFFNATFKQIYVASSESVVVKNNTAPEVEDMATPVQKQGYQSPITPGAETQSKANSWIYNWTH